MDRYEIRCTEEQTKMALNLEAPILVTPAEFYEELPHFNMAIDGENASIIIPTAEQMIGFLRSKGFRFHFDDVTNFWMITYNLEIIENGWNENKELAAIDAALEYLSNKEE